MKNLKQVLAGLIQTHLFRIILYKEEGDNDMYSTDTAHITLYSTKLKWLIKKPSNLTPWVKLGKKSHWGWSCRKVNALCLIFKTWKWSVHSSPDIYGRYGSQRIRHYIHTCWRFLKGTLPAHGLSLLVKYNSTFSCWPLFLHWLCVKTKTGLFCTHVVQSELDIIQIEKRYKAILSLKILWKATDSVKLAVLAHVNGLMAHRGTKTWLVYWLSACWFFGPEQTITLLRGHLWSFHVTCIYCTAMCVEKK